MLAPKPSLETIGYSSVLESDIDDIVQKKAMKIQCNEHMNNIPAPVIYSKGRETKEGVMHIKLM